MNGNDVIVKDREDVDNLESYRGEWMNLYFLKSGRSYLGAGTWSTEQEAQTTIDRTMQLVKETPNTIIINLLPDEIEYKETAFGIPMPVDGG